MCLKRNIHCGKCMKSEKTNKYIYRSVANQGKTVKCISLLLPLCCVEFLGNWSSRFVVCLTVHSAFLVLFSACSFWRMLPLLLLLSSSQHSTYRFLHPEYANVCVTHSVFILQMIWHHMPFVRHSTRFCTLNIICMDFYECDYHIQYTYVFALKYFLPHSLFLAFFFDRARTPPTYTWRSFLFFIYVRIWISEVVRRFLFSLSLSAFFPYFIWFYYQFNMKVFFRFGVCTLTDVFACVCVFFFCVLSVVSGFLAHFLWLPTIKRGIIFAISNVPRLTLNIVSVFWNVNS